MENLLKVFFEELDSLSFVFILNVDGDFFVYKTDGKFDSNNFFFIRTLILLSNEISKVLKEQPNFLVFEMENIVILSFFAKEFIFTFGLKDDKDIGYLRVLVSDMKDELINKAESLKLEKKSNSKEISIEEDIDFDSLLKNFEFFHNK